MQLTVVNCHLCIHWRHLIHFPVKYIFSWYMFLVASYSPSDIWCDSFGFSANNKTPVAYKTRCPFRLSHKYYHHHIYAHIYYISKHIFILFHTDEPFLVHLICSHAYWHVLPNNQILRLYLHKIFHN